MITEGKITEKVIELMETLDQVKKYSAITRSLNKFILIIVGSLATFFALLTVTEILELEKVLDIRMFFVVDSLSLLVPVIGLLCGVIFMKKKINSVQVGDWRPEISNGLSSSLKILVDLDWEKTLEVITFGRLGYAIYGLLKAGTYTVVTVSAFELFWNGLTLFFLHRIISAGSLFWGLVAISIVFIMLAKDLLKRYRELRALDMLVWELRWFSFEFRRAEFKT